MSALEVRKACAMRLTFSFKLAVLFVTCCYKGCVSLRDVKIIVPLAVEQGHRAILQCHYNLEGDTLYAVKWYKGEREFFRFTPRESPSIKQFAIPGHKVLEKESNGSYVVLEDVILENTGQYCCEVSADAPSFFTEQRAGFMQVVQSPRHDPVITGLKHRYRLGELLKAECKSNKSRPAANLTWFVNGRNVEPIHVRHHRPHYTEGYYISHSGLRIKISEELFSKGRLKIRCVANLFDVYHRSSEISVELERPKPRVAALPTLPPSMNWESLHRTELQTTLIFAPPEEQESNQGCVYPLHTKLSLLSLLLPLIALR